MKVDIFCHPMSSAAVEALIGAPPINIGATGLGERVYPQRSSGSMTIGSTSLVVDHLYAFPLMIPRALTIDQLSAKVTTLWGGGLFYLALYANSGPGFVYPGTAMIVSGALPGGALGWVDYAVGSPVWVTAGLYWVTINCSNSANTFASIPSAYNPEWSPVLGLNKTEYDAGQPQRMELDVAYAFAAPPNPFPAGAVTLLTTSEPIIAYRRSA
jgi:hypothetical protein